MRLLHTSTEKPRRALRETETEVRHLVPQMASGRMPVPTLRRTSTQIESFCKFVRASRPSHQWVWIDTCCIDKRNSAELTEPINSMYEWYQAATVCFVYLVDLPSKGQASARDRHAAFERSNWFRRGWTLQELLAPSDVVFCDREWNIYGSHIQLANRITEATAIDKAFLDGTYAPQEASVAMRMSWASNSSTTKTENIAYCLLGIYDVNMPPIYGRERRSVCTAPARNHQVVG